ncbi:hypothetical protein SDC9_202540 [bioreactor metagenome]|uniref:Uncharacterized protein n=1 Tax=bioreactor metagenome TaxID=1076179 RepID=A0A645IVH3_9ZZZZ
MARAHCAYRALLQHAQQLGLQADRHVTDLVEKQGASLCGSKQPRMASGCAAECTADMAEKFGFQQTFGYGAAVQGDERGACAFALLVDEPRQQLLACPAFALDQYAGFTACDESRLVEQSQHRFVTRQDAVLRG